MPAFIAYLRVSTIRQGESGLGIDAQRAAVEAHIRSAGGSLLATFTEVESGKKADRPELEKAMILCRVTGAALVVARLDRLARNLHFIAGLMASEVDFVACDAPHASRLTIGILAAVAEDEARRISERTKGALAAAKMRGIKLGGFRGHRPSEAQSECARAAYSETARKRSESLRGVVRELREAGITTSRAVAAALNARRIPAPRGGLWGGGQAQRLLATLN